MDRLTRNCFALLLLLAILLIAGCGGDGDESPVDVRINGLTRIENDAQYGLWARFNGSVELLDLFNTDQNGNASFTEFALLDTLQSGDEIFITIEPIPDPEPRVPTDTVVLSGIIQGDTATLVFPRLEEFANATAIATVSDVATNQVLVQFQNLPGVADLDMIYQGFLERNGVFTPLQRFQATTLPVSFTAPFSVTTAQLFITIEPEDDFDPNEPYSMRPFFSNGNLLPIANQPLTRSSLTPGDPNFLFPSGVATIR